MGQFLWKPQKKHKHAQDHWGFAPPPHNDQFLDGERIMCHKRADTLEMQLGILTGDVTLLHIGVTLPDFTEWALPYILIKDEDTNWAGWHNIEGLERVCHTDHVEKWAKMLVQFLINKPLEHTQSYAQPPRSVAYCTVDLRVWQNAYTLLDSVKFLQGDFCTPQGVFVASLLHGVRECVGGGGCVYPTHCSPWTYHALCMEAIAGPCEAVCPWPGCMPRQACNS